MFTFFTLEYQNLSFIIKFLFAYIWSLQKFYKTNPSFFILLATTRYLIIVQVRTKAIQKYASQASTGNSDVCAVFSQREPQQLGFHSSLWGGYFCSRHMPDNEFLVYNEIENIQSNSHYCAMQINHHNAKAII